MQLKDLLSLLSLLVVLFFVHFIYTHYYLVSFPVAEYLEKNQSKWIVEDKAKWASISAQYLDSSSNGTWHSLNETNIQWFSNSKNLDFKLDRNKVMNCVGKKWLFFHEDSSLRLLFSSVSQLINPHLMHDPIFPKYELCSPDLDDKQCEMHFKGFNDNRTETGATHFEYFREFWMPKEAVRVTFTFRQQLNNRQINFESFLSPTSQPDLMILQGGAWDKYNDYTVETAINNFIEFIDDLQRVYTGPFIWVSLVNCSPNFMKWAMEFNKRSRVILVKREIPILDRESSSFHLPQHMSNLCEGWHPLEKLTDLHRYLLFHSICSL